MNIGHKRSKPICPACGEGHLDQFTRNEEVTYKHATEKVQYRLSICNECGSELAGHEEVTFNNRKMLAFRKKVDQFLSGAEIKEFRNRFELTQEIAAQLFGGGKIAFSRYENDDICQSSSMDRLLRLCNEAPINILYLADMFSVDLSARQVALIEATYTSQSIEFAYEEFEEYEQVINKVEASAPITTPFSKRFNGALNSFCEYMGLREESYAI